MQWYRLLHSAGHLLLIAPHVLKRSLNPHEVASLVVKFEQMSGELRACRSYPTATAVFMTAIRNRFDRLLRNTTHHPCKGPAGG